MQNGDKQIGLYGKFKVERTDGSSEPGKKHEKCEYFVLDLVHDKFAANALMAYALACESEYPLLMKDLCNKIHEINHREKTLHATSGVTPPSQGLSSQTLPSRQQGRMEGNTL